MHPDNQGPEQKRVRARSAHDDGRTRRPYWQSPKRRDQRLERSLYEISGQPCFFTIRCYDRSLPFAQPSFASIAQECLLSGRERYDCEIDAYCVMPDHVHVIVTPREDGCSSLVFVDRFKGLTSYRLGKAGWTAKLWQPGYYDHLVTRDESMNRIVEYILHNPVRRGLCADPDAYPWSGIPDPRYTKPMYDERNAQMDHEIPARSPGL
jgi:REP element-mobilizing transposase RayT